MGKAAAAEPLARATLPRGHFRGVKRSRVVYKNEMERLRASPAWAKHERRPPVIIRIIRHGTMRVPVRESEEAWVETEQRTSKRNESRRGNGLMRG